jgi:hypothetical protein
MIKARLCQEIFHRAIDDGDSINILKSLASGATMNKGRNDKNTINCAIRSMLKDTFNLKFIEDLLDAGATIYSNDSNDALSTIIKHKDQYVCKNINEYDKDAEKNIKDMIRLLIERGAKSNNPEILDYAVYSRDIDFIELIIGSGVMPGPSTFKTAVKTKDLKILNLMYDYGARPDYHPEFDNYTSYSLIAALDTKNDEMIEKVCHYRARIDNSQTSSNTMSIALKYNSLKALQIICKYGAKPNNSQSSSNTMSIAAQYNSLEILCAVCAYGAEPDKTNTMHNTMTIAVLTKDLEKIKLVCQHGAVPNNIGTWWSRYENTFLCAVRTYDSEVIKETMMQGAKRQFTWNLDDNIFYIYYFWDKSSCESIESVDQMINILMCSGEGISYNLIELIAKNPDTYIGSKIKECYHLLNRYGNSSIEIIQKRDKLKKSLIETMEELMSGDLIAKKIKINEIDIGSNCSIPLPCIDIIYCYQSTDEDKKVKFIDWNKF